MGIKGPSVLALHKPFGFSKGFVVDLLHCVFFGVTKHFPSLWFSKKHSKKESSIKSKVAYLCKIIHDD